MFVCLFVCLGLFAEEDDVDVISLLNQSLADAELSDNEARLQYRMTTEITSRRYDTYSLASSRTYDNDVNV